MASLNPDAVLARGYVRVTGEDGRTLVGSSQAAAEARLTLHFRDGLLDVTPLDSEAVQHKAPLARHRRGARIQRQNRFRTTCSVDAPDRIGARRQRW
jgi:exodeoxyribonuclease VII large subunit